MKERIRELINRLNNSEEYNTMEPIPPVAEDTVDVLFEILENWLD